MQYRSLFDELDDSGPVMEIDIKADQGVTLRPYQREAVDAVFREWENNQSTLVVAPTGCHEEGHPILMHSGDVIPVEDVEVMDSIMGPDSSPRIVKELVRGRQEMYRIKCKQGPEFVVNAGHVLHLECTSEGKPQSCYKRGGEVDHLTVAEYLEKSKSWKHLRKIKSTGVEFTQCNAQKVIPPYVIGALLGDGTINHNRVILHSQDTEVVNEVGKCVAALGVKILPVDNVSKSAIEYHFVAIDKWQRTTFREELRALWMSQTKCEHKEIPYIYQCASSNDRLELLAGLIDTDGHYGSGVFDFISKSHTLAEGVQFVARSLGFRANCRECQKSSQNRTVGTYWRVCISGDVEKIPCRIPRKQARARKQKKDWTRYGFTVEYAGVGDYYGFILDKDHLYLDGNFVIHHNTGKSVIFSEVMRRWMEENQ